MTRDSPPELERVWPAPNASSSVTRAPSCWSCNAIQPPNAPAPATTTCISEIYTSAHSEGTRLVHLVADARAEAALAIEREERALVREVRSEENTPELQSRFGIS